MYRSGCSPIAPIMDNSLSFNAPPVFFICAPPELLPQAFEDLFHRFTDTLSARKKFHGYRLLAVDGTSLKSMSPSNPFHILFSSMVRMRLISVGNVSDRRRVKSENGIYTDVLVQKEHTKSEDAALCEMAGRSAGLEPVILLADRGYEAYNNFSR